ncbi:MULTISPECIES: non-hydrolyzing UDP-N-acetylglucosamine 2-epimerase [unclassified Micromonospora]|uniref:non-hydrolyzing UDP-N-acetylglucosamine 2-epimerase n=1 Tax=unclassified Micromonospora TaxID=2617518 RepID=UPI00362A220C
MRSIAVIIGTRPEAIKVAPIIRTMREDSRFRPVVVSTGQHRQMLDETLRAFDIEPCIDLGIMATRQTLSEVTYRVIQGLGEHLGSLDVDAVMVHGDTATTLAGAVAGFQHQLPVIHVEAGLRSGNVHSPFPEEANRRLVGQIAALHLAPTPGNAANLIREGADVTRIVVTGNTVIDALQWGVRQQVEFTEPALRELEAGSDRVVLASAHRRESHGAPMPEIGRALLDIADMGAVRVVVPMHRNPAVRDVLMPLLSGHPRITIVDPLPYLQFCRLMQRSDIILSDSSGAEEEGPALGKPTLVLRDLTERPEAVAAGTARLVGRTRARIAAEVQRILLDDVAYAEMATAVNPYGDGRATERVLAGMCQFFDMGPSVPPFVPGIRTIPRTPLPARLVAA